MNRISQSERAVLIGIMILPFRRLSDAAISCLFAAADCSFQKQDLHCCTVVSSLKPVEIHSAGQVAGAERDRMITRALMLMDKNLHVSTQGIANGDCNETPCRRLVADDIRRVQWIGVVLLKYKLVGYLNWIMLNTCRCCSTRTSAELVPDKTRGTE